MFDEFREQANQALEDELEKDAEISKSGIAGLIDNLDISQIKNTVSRFTPIQRAVIAALLLILVCLFSILCLLITGSIAPPL